MEIAKILASGVVVIGLVTAFGIHANQLAKLPRPTGKAFQGILHTAERG